MKTLLKWSLPVTLLLATAAFVVSWQIEAQQARRRWKANIARQGGQPIPVRTATVSVEDQVDVMGGTAVTRPTMTTAVGVMPSNNRVAAREVVELRVGEGEVVQRGQPLVVFRRHIFELIANQRRAALALAKEQVTSLTNLHAKRAASLIEVKDAQLQLQTAELELALADQDLELCVVKSPISGVIGQCSVAPDMFVYGEHPMMAIHQIDPIQVEVDFPVEWVNEIALHQTAEIRLDPFGDETFYGAITKIASIASPKTRAVQVVVELPNPNHRIKAGVTGFMRVQRDIPNVTTVPTAAVIKRHDQSVVFRVEGDRARLQAVETGRMLAAGLLQVIDGLSVGDEVVIFGHDKLRNNDLIDVNWQEWARRNEL